MSSIDVCDWVEKELATLGDPLVSAGDRIGRSQDNEPLSMRPVGTVMKDSTLPGCLIDTSGQQRVTVEFVPSSPDARPEFGMAIGADLTVYSDDHSAIVPFDNGLSLRLSANALNSGHTLSVLAGLLAPGFVDDNVPRFPRTSTIDRADFGALCTMIPLELISETLATWFEQEAGTESGDNSVAGWWRDGTCFFRLGDPGDAVSVSLRIGSPGGVGHLPCSLESTSAHCDVGYTPADGGLDAVIITPERDLEVGLEEALFPFALMSELLNAVPADRVFADDTTLDPRVIVESETQPTWAECTTGFALSARQSAAIQLVVCATDTETLIEATIDGNPFAGSLDGDCAYSDDRDRRVCMTFNRTGIAPVSFSVLSDNGYEDKIRQYASESWNIHWDD